MNHVGQFVFSVWVWLSAFVWMLLAALLTMLLRIVGVPYQRVHMWVTAPMFAKVPRLATARVRVHYHHEFDPDVRSVFVQNHINLLDGHIASAAIPHAFSGLMNAWQFKIPIYGWLMSLSKGIPVDRRRRDKIIHDISAAARNRKQIGMSILTFPEGHRTLDGHVRPFKRGVFLMARNAQMPVVPIAVAGLFEVNNKRTGWRFRPFVAVDVFVGPQFETNGLGDEQVAQLAQRVGAWVSHCVEHREWPHDPVTSGGPTLPT